MNKFCYITSFSVVFFVQWSHGAKGTVVLLCVFKSRIMRIHGGGLGSKPKAAPMVICFHNPISGSTTTISLKSEVICQIQYLFPYNLYLNESATWKHGLSIFWSMISQQNLAESYREIIQHISQTMTYPNFFISIFKIMCKVKHFLRNVHKTPLKVLKAKKC